MISDSQKWLLLTAVVLVAVLVYLLAPVLTPFLISALLAYLGDPLVDRLERLGLTRTLGVCAVFSVMFFVAVIALVIVVPILERQAASLIGRLPQALEWLQGALTAHFGTLLGDRVIEIDLGVLRRTIVEHWGQFGSVASQIVRHLSQSGQLLLGWVAYLLLIPVVTFYLLRDWDVLVTHIDKLLPHRIRPTVRTLAGEIDAVLAEFLRGQLTLMMALAVLYTLGLWMVGIELALVIGSLAGVVSFVPYMGLVVGLAVAGVAAFAQFQDFMHVLAVGAVFGVGQLLDGMLLSPLLVGDRIGLHPVAVIFAVMAGGQLFGFFGILVALPVAAIIVVLLRHSRDGYLQSSLYS